MANTKILLKKHAVVIAKTRRELAMNFNIPSHDIILMACAEMGISEKQWRELESYDIDRKVA